MSFCLVSVVFRQVEFSGTGRLLIQRSSTECDVSQSDRESSKMRRSSPTKAVSRYEYFSRNGGVLQYYMFSVLRGYKSRRVMTKTNNTFDKCV